MSSHGYPDFQRYAQWFGTPLVAATALAIGAGSHDDGPFPVNNWSSVVLYLEPTGGAITATLRQTSSGVPAALRSDTVLSIAAGETLVQSVVLLGNSVELLMQGTTVGETVSYALVPANTAVNTGTVSEVFDAGMMMVFAGSAAPSGWLLCDGSAVSRTTYAALFSAIGTAYGVGDGATTFNLPDLRGRSPVGLGTNAAVNALGVSDGVAVANRRGTKHRHTAHSHNVNNDALSLMSSVVGATADVYAKGGASDVPSNHPFAAAAPTTQGADGGSGVAADPLDGGAFVVVNYIVKT